MKIAEGFQRTHITRRQLVDQDPEARKLLDHYGGETVGELRQSVDYLERLASGKRDVLSAWAAATGAAALGVGCFNPWIGLALGAVATAPLAAWALVSHSDVNRIRAEGEQLETLAESTEENLVQSRPDGTVLDKRFLDLYQFHDPCEVSRNGQPIERSIRIENRDDTLSAHADLSRGTVTVIGSLGSGTFPGTLTLPTVYEPSAIITRTDVNANGFNSSELSFDWHSSVGLNLVNGSQLMGSDGPSRGIKNGVLVAWNDAGQTAAIKAPLRSEYLENPTDLENELSQELNGKLTLFRRVDVPRLEPLQAVDLKDRLTVSGLRFMPTGFNVFHLRPEGENVKITNELTPPVTVQGSLTEDGRLVMRQGAAEVTQSFEDLAVRLKVRVGEQEYSVVHELYGEPQGDQRVPVTEQDGVYTIQLSSGPVKVSPAIGLGLLDRRPA